MELGEPKWRARQILRWMYAKKSVDSFESMLNLPVSLRDALAKSARMECLKVQALFTARDQTVKALMQLPSGRNVESVLIPHFDDHGHPIRLTVCVSSQVGCAMGCTFLRNRTNGLPGKSDLWADCRPDHLYAQDRVRTLRPGSIQCGLHGNGRNRSSTIKHF